MLKLLKGQGIDIGCGTDPIRPDAKCFDISDGDANEITKYIKNQFDYVYASHCLEHMRDPHKAVNEWWQIVKPGGYLFLIVPDEDLYEQGVFPSRFNPDHKATFTISKRKSWFSASVNLYDLLLSLENGKSICIELQDNNYDRSRMKHGRCYRTASAYVHTIHRILSSLKILSSHSVSIINDMLYKPYVIDQKLNDDSLAQICGIVPKKNK